MGLARRRPRTLLSAGSIAPSGTNAMTPTSIPEVTSNDPLVTCAEQSVDEATIVYVPGWSIESGPKTTSLPSAVIGPVLPERAAPSSLSPRDREIAHPLPPTGFPSSSTTTTLIENGAPTFSSPGCA